MKRLNVYSQLAFDMEMLKNGWKISVPEHVAIISICNVDNVEHFFEYDDTNILNVDFNDVDEEGYKPITDSIAKTIVDFIQTNIGKDFYIHCYAGYSRSQAIAKYILDTYPDYDYKTRINNPCTHPNMHVYNMLLLHNKNNRT